MDNETSEAKEKQGEKGREMQSWGGEKIHITRDSPGTIRRSDI